MSRNIVNRDFAQINAGGVLNRGRNSNLELLRIISMLLIVAHHFVVNSGVMAQFDFLIINSNLVFLQLFGMWGKTAINIFVLISGYFLCEMTLTWQRWLKVYLQWKIYRILIFISLLFVGYESLTMAGLFKIIFETVRSVNHGFIGSFLFFYLLVPFYNLFLKKLSKRNHIFLLGIFLMFFTVFETFLAARSIFTESAWYMILYILAAYLKKYSPGWTNSKKVSLGGLLVCIIIAWMSVGFLDFIGMKAGGKNIAYYMVSDSNKLLAFLVGAFAFLTFKNMKYRANKIINTVSATTFGVLCIHASSDAMRTMLWKDMFNVQNAYSFSLGRLIVYSIGTVILVFAVSSIIDYMRLKFIERPMFRVINQRTADWRPNERNMIKRILAIYNNIEADR